MKFHTDNGARP